MYCDKCGAELPSNVKFCPKCGAPVNNGSSNTGTVGGNANQRSYSNNSANAQTSSSSDKIAIMLNRVLPILNIVAGAIMVIEGFVRIDFDWGWISLLAGAGLLLMGILSFTKVKSRTIYTIEIIFGALTLLFGLISATGTDWATIGIFAGVMILISGILNILNRSQKVTAIVEVVFSGIVLILGFACVEYIWGDTGIFVSIPFLFGGIVKLAQVRQQKSEV